MKRVLTLFGTRPEVIKLAPVLAELERRSDCFETVNVASSQHVELLHPFARRFDIRVDADLEHVRGVLSMARASDPDSGGSQFFIMLAAASHLDGKYAAFGKVIEGMDIIDALQKGDGANGSVSKPDKIVKMTVESMPAKSAPEK